MNAKVNIDIVVTSKWQDANQSFHPVYAQNQDFHYVTDLDDYAVTTTQVNADLVDYLADQLDGTVYIQVRIDNPTHPQLAAGVIALPKSHWSSTLSKDEVVGTTLKQQIDTQLVNMRQAAKY